MIVCFIGKFNEFSYETFAYFYGHNDPVLRGTLLEPLGQRLTLLEFDLNLLFLTFACSGLWILPCAILTTLPSYYIL